MQKKTIVSESNEREVAPQKATSVEPQCPCQSQSQDLGTSLRRLQRTHGNQFVRRLLRARLIQPKLTVSEPGDQYEQEAERVADQVMGMTDVDVAAASSNSAETSLPQIQRVCSECNEKIQRQVPEEEEEEEEMMVRAPGQVQRLCGECEEELGRQADEQQTVQAEENEAEALVHSVLDSPGQELGASAQNFFEPRFGRDFSAVRVHTDEAAAQSAQAVSARAYTFGHHIVFGQGQFNPNTETGRRLLAHELAHVVQQAPETVKRKASFKNGEEALSPGAKQLSALPAIQRDWALEPPQPNAVGRVLTPDEMTDALDFNNRVIGAGGADLIREVRDVLGVSPDPAVVDEEFVNAIVRWQAVQGLTQDGKLGPATARPLFREIGAEGVGECKVKTGATYSPGGTITSTVAGGIESASFTFSAEFENDPATGVFPSCCEVRQFIRWNAAAAAAFPTGVPHAGFPAGHPADTFIEDRDDRDTRYGHRSGVHSDPVVGDEYTDATGARNQAFGHIYNGSDNPGGPTALLVGQWRFYLKVIDVCNGGRRVGGDDLIRINW